MWQVLKSSISGWFRIARQVCFKSGLSPMATHVVQRRNFRQTTADFRTEDWCIKYLCNKVLSKATEILYTNAIFKRVQMCFALECGGKRRASLQRVVGTKNEPHKPSRKLEGRVRVPKQALASRCPWGLGVRGHSCSFGTLVGGSSGTGWVLAKQVAMCCETCF